MRPLVILLLLCGNLLAQDPPDVDQRYANIRHTDSVFEMPTYATAAQWQERAEYLRHQVLWSAGLDPLPERNALRAQIKGTIHRDGYTIEKVLLETAPGFYLGGNLYRPETPSSRHSGVLLSHGHWTYGRLENSDTASPPTLAANLALQGHTVFAYDMVGYNDTAQFPHEDFAAPAGDLHNINLLGLQLWNSIRALDFLESLESVSSQHLYAAGASGGATQAMLLAATDDRVSAVALANMISFHMQGGDPCENAPGLRVNTNNVELTALIAPRPLLLVSSTGDWTANTPSTEFPALQSLYALVGNANSVANVHHKAPHKFNQVGREAVYSFFDPQHRAIAERSVSIPQPSELLSLWGESYPANATKTRSEYVKARASSIALPTPDRLQLTLQVTTPSKESILSTVIETWRNGEFFAIGRSGEGDRIPGALLRPRRTRDWVKPTLIIHPEGSLWSMSSSESRDGYVANLLSRGGSVMAVDVFQTGRVAKQRNIETAGPRAARYFTTFNRSDTSHRVQDILTAVAYAQQQFASDDIQLVCPLEAGLWCALALPFLDESLDVAIDWHNFDATGNEAYADRLHVPGIQKLGGISGFVSHWRAGRQIVYNANESFLQSSQNTPSRDVQSGAIDWDELLEWSAPRRRPK